MFITIQNLTGVFIEKNFSYSIKVKIKYIKNLAYNFNITKLQFSPGSSDFAFQVFFTREPNFASFV